jgi:orotate phosphoribosyltransferase
MDTVSLYEACGGLLRGHFLLSSGQHSDTYMQSELIFMHPDIASEMIIPLAHKVSEINFTTIASPAIGGIRFGYELARQLHKKAIFTERADGIMQLRRGFTLAPGEPVLIAEDVLTTGKSTKECIDAITAFGAEAVAVVSIIDRRIGASDDGFFEHPPLKLPYYSLAKIEVNTWPSEDCPLCKNGTAIFKPGSRLKL